MLNLEFSNKEGKLAHFQTRMENHGEDHKLACDVKMLVETTSEKLAHFAPDLRAMLFKKDLENAGTETPRFTKVAPIRWNEEMTGARFTVDLGLLGKVELSDAKVGKFVIEAREAGAVTITFKISAPVDGERSGKLCELAKSVITFALVPPELPTMGEPQDE